MHVWDELIYTQLMDSDVNSFYSQFMNLCDRYMRACFLIILSTWLFFFQKLECMHNSSYRNMQAIWFRYQLICLTSDAAKVWRVIRPTSPGSQGQKCLFAWRTNPKKKETKELNMDYGNENKVYIFKLVILRSPSFGWQFCEAHCLE